MSNKQSTLFDERVKEMVLIPKGMYEKFKDSNVSGEETALVDTELRDLSETRKEQSGRRNDEHENVYKDSVQVDNVDQNVVNLSKGNNYDLLLKNKWKVISDLSTHIEKKNDLTSVRWQKISQSLTQKQVNKLIPVQKNSLDLAQFEVLFSKSKVLRNIFDKMHFDSDNSSVVHDKKDMVNDSQPPFPPKKQPTENDEQLPVLRTKEVEQNKPIMENSMTSIKEKDTVDNLTMKKKRIKRLNID